MDEWWAYRLSDLILFSDTTYYRLFELYNQDIWPLQLVTKALGLFVLLLLWRRPAWHGRVISLILVICWCWVAWSYHQQRFTNINIAAPYYAWLFYAQAGLLFWFGVIKDQFKFDLSTENTAYLGLAIYGFALVIYPFIGQLYGRPWMQMEVFGIAPDPTVLATLGLLLLSHHKHNWLLYVIPICWCLISGATLWVFESPDAFVLPFNALFIVIINIAIKLKILKV